MKRRNFVISAAVASTFPFYTSGQKPQQDLQTEKELYELRTYVLKFGANQNQLTSYLSKVLQPALERAGANYFKLFEELGQSDPKKLWLLISYPDAITYVKAQKLHEDPVYMEEAAPYSSLPAHLPLFTRYSSSLLLAFDALPRMMNPISGASLFELRTYEGYNEDAVRRKIEMFNREELSVFLKTGLNPVFFGDMIAGPYRPCLTYMLNFKDMAERDANWQKFLEHPEWEAMRVKEKYANTVSNIRRLFLKPV